MTRKSETQVDKINEPEEILSQSEPDTVGDAFAERTVPVPDFVRRALELGFTGFFTTEQTIRKAFGEAMPQDWVDFVSAQSDRTRKEMTEAITAEFARSLERIDFAEALDGFLSGRNIEINATIRLAPREEERDRSDPAKRRSR
jgi:hypothetical protein